MKHRILKAAVLLLVLAGLSAAQVVASFEKRITVKKLPNGLTLLICERPEAPVFAFFTMVVAAAEVVIGLAIIMTIFRARRSTSVDDANLLKY